MFYFFRLNALQSLRKLQKRHFYTTNISIQVMGSFFFFLNECKQVFMTDIQVTDLAVSVFRICAQIHEYVAYAVCATLWSKK